MRKTKFDEGKVRKIGDQGEEERREGKHKRRRIRKGCRGKERKGLKKTRTVIKKDKEKVIEEKVKIKK